MIEGVDVAGRNCKCNRCHRTIDAGEMRGWKYDDKWGSYGGRNYYCRECAIEILKEQVLTTEELLEELRRGM